MGDAGDSRVSASHKNYFAIATRIEGRITTIPLLLHTNFIVAAHCLSPILAHKNPIVAHLCLLSLHNTIWDSSCKWDSNPGHKVCDGRLLVCMMEYDNRVFPLQWGVQWKCVITDHGVNGKWCTQIISISCKLRVFTDVLNLTGSKDWVSGST